MLVVVLIILLSKKFLEKNNSEHEEVKEEVKTEEVKEETIVIGKKIVDDKKYSNYSRGTVINIEKEYAEAIKVKKIYIENDALYVLDINGKKHLINLDNEIPKYLGEAHDCGGAYFIVLTTSGSIYRFMEFFLTDKLINDTIEAKDLLSYGTKKQEYEKADDMIILYDVPLFNTCGGFAVYPVVDGKIIGRDELHPWDRQIRITKNGEESILIYLDGSLNSYVYGSGPDNFTKESEVKNEFVEINNQKLIVSFIYFLNDKIYIVDTLGNIYNIDNQENLKVEKDIINFNLTKVDSKKVKEITYNYTNDSYNLNYLVVKYVDGSEQKYAKEDFKIALYS